MLSAVCVVLCTVTKVSFCGVVFIVLNWSGSGAFKVTNKLLISYESVPRCSA